MEIICACNGFSCLYSLVPLAIVGRTMESFAFMFGSPYLMMLCGCFSLCNLLGTDCLLKVVSEFGANTAVVVTSTRKVVTVICSYVLFPKPFSAFHAVGLSSVAVGVYLHETNKSHHGKAESKLPPTPPDFVPSTPFGVQPGSPA